MDGKMIIQHRRGAAHSVRGLDPAMSVRVARAVLPCLCSYSTKPVLRAKSHSAMNDTQPEVAVAARGETGTNLRPGPGIIRAPRVGRLCLNLRSIQGKESSPGPPGDGQETNRGWPHVGGRAWCGGSRIGVRADKFPLCARRIREYQGYLVNKTLMERILMLYSGQAPNPSFTALERGTTIFWILFLWLSSWMRDAKQFCSTVGEAKPIRIEKWLESRQSPLWPSTTGISCIIYLRLDYCTWLLKSLPKCKTSANLASLGNLRRTLSKLENKQVPGQPETTTTIP